MRTRALLPLVLAVSFALTGCQAGMLAPTESESAPASEAPPVESPTQQPTASPSEGEPTEVPTQEPLAPGEAVDFTCDELFTLQQLYDFDPNFSPVNETDIDLPGAFTSIAEAGGLVCAFKHVTADALLVVGAAPAGVDFGDNAGFTNNGALGTETSEGEQYSVAVGSSHFGSEGDAAGIIEQVQGNLAAFPVE